jgi:hypothetical protein
MVDAPYGWTWMDNDPRCPTWVYDYRPQHPHERGEALDGSNFRPVTQEQLATPDFQAEEIHLRCLRDIYG